VVKRHLPVIARSEATHELSFTPPHCEEPNDEAISLRVRKRHSWRLLRRFAPRNDSKIHNLYVMHFYMNPQQDGQLSSSSDLVYTERLNKHQQQDISVPNPHPMNLILFDPTDQKDPSLVIVTGERAQHMIRVQKVQREQILRVGQLGGKMGHGMVVDIGQESVTLEIELRGQAPKEPDVDFIVAVARPQILKKILQTSAAMGVRRLMLVASTHTEKSYFSSPVLQPKYIFHHLCLGLEQAIATYLPLVSIHMRFRAFLAEEMNQLLPLSSYRLLAHPGVNETLACFQFSSEYTNEKPYVVAIGPERGWAEEEINLFEEHLFKKFTLGERILRVDTAVCAVHAQLSLLREMAEKKFITTQ